MLSQTRAKLVLHSPNHTGLNFVGSAVRTSPSRVNEHPFFAAPDLLDPIVSAVTKVRTADPYKIR